MSSAADTSDSNESNHLFTFGRWVGAAVFAAVISAGTSWFVSAQLNRDALIAQDSVYAIQAFEQSGGDMDAKVSKLADLVVDKKSLSDAKADAREAIGSHAAKARAVRNAVGIENADAYVDTLAKLREAIDSTKDIDGEMKVARIHAALISARDKMSANARAKTLHGA